MTRLLSVVSLLLLKITLWAGQASANIVYSFSGVTFNDGATLTGTFTTNDSFNALLNFNITTSAGTIPGFTFTPGTSDGTTSTSLPFILVANTPLTSFENVLQVTFNNLTAAGAQIKVGAFDSFEQGPPGNIKRVIEAGSVIAVPEPSSVLFGIGGLGLLAYVVRRRRA